MRGCIGEAYTRVFDAQDCRSSAIDLDHRLPDRLPDVRSTRLLFERRRNNVTLVREYPRGAQGGFDKNLRLLPKGHRGTGNPRHRGSISLDPRADRANQRASPPPCGGNYDAVLIFHCVAAPSFRRVSQAAVDTSVTFRMEWKERVRSHESAGSVEGSVAEVSAFSLV